MADVSNTTLLGAAAEHYVMCQLLRRQMIAALAPVGVPDTDIVVSNRCGDALAAIQVKARRNIGSDGGWHMKKKHENMIRKYLFYCFIDFGNDLKDTPKCWIIPSEKVAEVLSFTYRAWLFHPGKNGKKHNDTDMRRLSPDYRKSGSDKYHSGWLDDYHEAWHLIASMPNDKQEKM